MLLPLFSADRSILEPLLERRASSGARVEDLPLREDSENRMSKFKRKDWSLSKSQVIAEKAPEPDLMVKKKKHQSFASAFPVARHIPVPFTAVSPQIEAWQWLSQNAVACGGVGSQMVLRKARTGNLSLYINNGSRSGTHNINLWVDAWSCGSRHHVP